MAGFDADGLLVLLSAERSDVDAKLRQSMPTSVDATMEEGPAPAKAVLSAGVVGTAERSERATVLRKSDMMNMWVCEDSAALRMETCSVVMLVAMTWW